MRADEIHEALEDAKEICSRLQIPWVCIKNKLFIFRYFETPVEFLWLKKELSKTKWLKANLSGTEKTNIQLLMIWGLQSQFVFVFILYSHYDGHKRMHKTACTVTSNLEQNLMNLKNDLSHFLLLKVIRVIDESLDIAPDPSLNDG